MRIRRIAPTLFAAALLSACTGGAPTGSVVDPASARAALDEENPPPPPPPSDTLKRCGGMLGSGTIC